MHIESGKSPDPVPFKSLASFTLISVQLELDAEYIFFEIKVILNDLCLLGTAGISTEAMINGAIYK